MPVTLIERLIVNLYTPLEKTHLTGDCNENRGKSFKDLFNEKVENYLALVRIAEFHNGIPKTIYDSYSHSPCGRNMLKTYKFRCLFTKNSPFPIDFNPSNQS